MSKAELPPEFIEMKRLFEDILSHGYEVIANLKDEELDAIELEDEK